MAPTQVLQVTDQGWAWVVLMAVLISQGLSLGYTSCVGVFYKDIQASFQATNSETSWLPSIVTAVLHAGGLLVDFTGHYRYIFYAITVNGCSAALFLGLSAFALKRKEAKLQETAKLAKMEPLMGEPKKTDEVHQNPPEVIFLTTI